MPADLFIPATSPAWLMAAASVTKPGQFVRYRIVKEGFPGVGCATDHSGIINANTSVSCPDVLGEIRYDPALHHNRNQRLRVSGSSSNHSSMDIYPPKHGAAAPVQREHRTGCRPEHTSPG